MNLQAHAKLGALGMLPGWKNLHSEEVGLIKFIVAHYLDEQNEVLLILIITVSNTKS